MKNLILFLCMLPLLLNSCKKNLNEPIPEELPPEDQAFSELVVDASGGILETEDFTLSVPEGAFDTTVTLRLYLEENDPVPTEEKVTNAYQLTGLNCNWNEPLELKIRYEGTLEGESYIAIGYKYYDVELEDSVLVNELFSADDSEGFLKCTLPPMEAANAIAKSTMLTPYDHPVILLTKLILRGLSKTGTLKSESAEIKYDLGIDQSKVETFASYMDEAMYFFHAMGLLDKDIYQGDYKVRVQIFDEPSEFSNPSFIEPKYRTWAGISPKSRFNTLSHVFMIKIPESSFLNADDKQLRMLAGEGIFRFETYFFFENEKNWLHWASIFWVREYFYGSNLRSVGGKNPYSLLMQPFWGINTNNMEDDIILPWNPLTRDYLHGYGMTPLLKYLLENHNEDLDLLTKMYYELMQTSDRKHPVEAILNSVSTTEDIWLPGFFKDYLEGTIWDIPGETFLEKIDSDDVVNFVNETDTLKYLDRDYPDLSARLFQVNLAIDLVESGLGDGDKLKFELGPKSLNMDYVKVLVFRYKKGEIAFLGEGSEVTVNNVKSLLENGDATLLAAVVNSANEYPFLEKMNIELTIKLVKERIWPWKYVTIDALVTDAIHTSPTMGETSWGNFTHKLADHLLEESEDGTRFTASWLEQDSNYKNEGGIDIVVDTLTYEITWFYAWSNMESISDNKVTQFEKHTIEGKAGLSIPVVYWDDDYLTHQVSGEEVCSVIEKWSYEYCSYPGESYELKNTLSSYTCNYNANLLFFWAREKEK